MNVIATELPGVLIVEPKVFPDARGFFVETYNKERYAACGIAADFVQDNLSFSSRGVLRGLHYQNPHAQGKLIRALKQTLADAAKARKVEVTANASREVQEAARKALDRSVGEKCSEH